MRFHGKLAVLGCLALVLGCRAAHAQPVNLAGPWKLQLTDDPRWAQPDVDDRAWPVVQLPQLKPRPETVYWLRRTVTAPTFEGPMVLTVGLVSESYEVYVNGVRVGGTGDFGAPEVRFFQPREFRLPDGLLTRGGSLLIALRIWNRNVLWGSVSYGVKDQGPYWITGMAHASAELRDARKGVGNGLILIEGVLLVLTGIGVCLLILWLPERHPPEAIWYAAFLLIYASVYAFGIWIVETGGTSFWWRWAYRQDVLAAQVVLTFAVTAACRVPLPPRWMIVVVSLLSVTLELNSGNAYHLFPWQALQVLQAVRGIRISWRNNLVFALPCFVYVIVGTNNVIPMEFRLLPRAVLLFGLPLSLISLIQACFSIATLIVLMRRLSADRLEKQRLENEVEAARTMQQLLLPPEHFASSHFVVDAVYEPALEVGGDFHWSRAQDDGSLLVISGDVSGKGLRAALLVSVAIGILRAVQSSSPGVILSSLNAGLTGHTGGGFVTACCARFDPNGQVTLANAGNPAPYSDGREVEVEGSLPLGIAAEAEYLECVVEAGHMTFVSDGVVEAANTAGELFGFERMAKISAQSAREIAEIAKAWGQNDDITVVTVRQS